MHDWSEFSALRRALRMMGLDPTRVAAFVADESDGACKAVLLQCVGLDEARLRAVAGEGTDIDGWRAAWRHLLAPGSPAETLAMQRERVRQVGPVPGEPK